MLNQIAAVLQSKGLVNNQWLVDAEEQGQLVKLCRDYYDGFHRLQLTSEMKKMLNISDERLERYNANYCSLIIDRMADRLIVEQFEAKMVKPETMPIDPNPMTPLPNGSTPPPPPMPDHKEEINPAQEWVEDWMDYNRFDGLQRDVTVSYLTDGVTFVISYYDNVEKRMCFAHELAYDGDVGTLVIYQRGSYSTIAAAVKIWYDVPPTPEQKLDGEQEISLFKRVNIYYPNRTDKYYSTDGVSIRPLVVPVDELITERAGRVPGVPVVPFYNKGGVSELVNIIPLQDSLNSALVDLVMAGRLTAFSIVFGVGVSVPQGLTPGMTIFKNIVDENGKSIIPQSAEEAQAQAAILGAARLERLPVGDLSQIINGIELIINQIGVISSTPLPGNMGSDSSSGESLKQREVGMLGKLNRAQTQLGNAWEDVIFLAANQQTIFGDKNAPMIDKLNTRWKSAEIRNDTDVLALFKLLREAGYERAALRALGQSSLASYSEDDIQKMMDEKAADTAKKTVDSAGNLPGFDNFNIPTAQPQRQTGQVLNFNPVTN